MGINHTKEIFEAYVEWPTPSHKLVALMMAYVADRRGVIRDTQGGLAHAVGLSRQRINTIIDDLCRLEVIKRLGHGRYGLRFGLPTEKEEEFDHSRILPHPRGADTEVKRIMGILQREREEDQERHGIAWRPDGWPVMTDLLG